MARNVADEAAIWGLHYGLHEGLYGWIAKCDCGVTLRASGVYNAPPKQMVRRFNCAGWKMQRNCTPVCDTCNGRGTMAQKSTPSIGPDPKLARKIYALLDDHFDEDTRLYKPGWDDERVAKEIDVSVTVVKDIRRQAYGELAEDPKVTALRDDIELLRMEFNDQITKLSEDFEKRLAELISRLPSKFKVAC